MHSRSKHGAAKQTASQGAGQASEPLGHQRRAENCQLLQEARWRRPQLLQQILFQLLQVCDAPHWHKPKAFSVAAKLSVLLE